MPIKLWDVYKRQGIITYCKKEIFFSYWGIYSHFWTLVRIKRSIKTIFSLILRQFLSLCFPNYILLSLLFHVFVWFLRQVPWLYQIQQWISWFTTVTYADWTILLSFCLVEASPIVWPEVSMDWYYVNEL